MSGEPRGRRIPSLLDEGLLGMSGGSNPTSPLHTTSVKKFRVRPCGELGTKAIRAFIETHHYLHNVNGVRIDYCFGLYHEERLIGAAIFGKPAMANIWRKYVNAENKLTELRRFYCVDDAPKNTESRFIGICARWLQKRSPVEAILSYSDPHFGHEGIIYKATGFTYLGQTACSKVIKFDGREWHEKVIRNKHNGKLKPFAIRLKKALDDGKAVFESRNGKHIFIKTIR